MATVEVTKDLVGCWYLVLSNDSDWLCSLTEIEPDKTYRIQYRFRYYKDDKVFDSADDKSSYRAEVTSTRSFAIASVRMLANAMEAAGATGKVDELLMVNGDVDAFAEALFNKPWAFARIESGKPKP